MTISKYKTFKAQTSIMYSPYSEQIKDVKYNYCLENFDFDCDIDQSNLLQSKMTT
jgi:hypothetical protein